MEFGDASLNDLNKLEIIFDRTATASKTKTNITEVSHQPLRVQAPPKENLIKDPIWSSTRVIMTNKQATSPVTSYTGRSHEMPPPIHWYNTRTKPKKM